MTDQSVSKASSPKEKNVNQVGSRSSRRSDAASTVCYAGLVVGVVAMTSSSGCARKTAGAPAAKPPAVIVDHPIAREVTEYEEFTGRIDAVRTVDLRARVTGYLEKANFKEGADINENDLLFEIDQRPYRAELDRTLANVAQARAKLERTNSEHQRALKLLKQRSMSQEEADTYIYNRAEAEAALSGALAMQESAELNLGFTQVTAPFSGRISRRLVDPGNLVRADETILTTLVSLDPIYAYFDVDERTLLRLRRLIHEGKIRSARETEVSVQIGLADEDGYSLSGVINFADNRVDPNTGTLRVRAIIQNPKKFLSPGLFVRVRLPIGIPHEATLVPEEAIATDQGRKFLYIVDAKDEVIYQPVKIGLQEEKMRVIESGVTTADRVIVSGLQRVRPKMKVTPTTIERAAKTEPVKSEPTDAARDAKNKSANGASTPAKATSAGAPPHRTVAGRIFSP